MVDSLSSRQTFYLTLTRKIRVLILIVSFLPMVLAAGILFYRFNHTYTEKIQAHISELVQKHTQNIDTFLSEKLRNIRTIAWFLKISDEKPERFLHNSMNLLKKEYGDTFTDLGLINDRGIQFAYEGPFNLEEADYAEADWFRKAMDMPYYISDVFAGLRGHPHFIIAVKVRLNDADYILRSTINFAEFNSLVENIHIGKTGIAFIVNPQGLLQTQTNARIRRAGILPVADRNQYREGKTLFTRKKDADGNPYIHVTSMLKNIDWLMVFRQDLQDAFHDVWKAQLPSLIIMILGCGAVLSLAFVLPRNIVRLISNADQKSEDMNKQVVESGKLATIGELAAGIAHEINNPVAIMIEEAGWIEDLMEEEDPDQVKNMDEISRALRQINTQGRRCKEITHKLLSFARKTDFKLKDVQINDAVREIVSLTLQMAKYNNITIQTRLGENIPYIRISPSELQQVILNLINNAIDAMEKTGGIIQIETRLIKNDGLIISIKDNGPGIPKDNLDRIFDPFFTTKPVGKGTGLGLSICYGIIQKMGGEIEVASQVDVGTQFKICLPCPDEGTGETDLGTKSLTENEEN
ncbi:sensor histidine kinase [Desulfospira joergensenii]|uniref:sensor histidine kinase n=1 Tax=Desulfospira joergensenii TaxID=53329 RepID=UPI0003B56BDC|nr:PAS domain-containing sensor histidine kinase [Desulfospira joergensenii]